MNEPQIYLFDKWRIRVAVKDGKAWFVAKDVAEALEYAWNGTRNIEHIPERWRGVESVSTPSGIQPMAILSLEGLFFFLNRSDKPAAQPFQEWVNGTVLPEIHRTGTFSAAKPAKAGKLPAGIQLHELRMIYGEKEAAKRLDFVLGYSTAVGRITVEPDATPAQAAAAFAELRDRFPDVAPRPGLPAGTVEKVTRAAAGAARATLAKIDRDAQASALQPELEPAS